MELCNEICMWIIIKRIFRIISDYIWDWKEVYIMSMSIICLYIVWKVMESNHLSLIIHIDFNYCTIRMSSACHHQNHRGQEFKKKHSMSL